MTEPQRELATQYMPMARTLAREAMGGTMSIEELEAEAYAALVDAARTFDPDRGVNFAVHARTRIVGAIRDYRRFLFHASWKGDAHESPVFQRQSTTDEICGRVLGKERHTPAVQEFDTHEAVDSVIRLLPDSHAVACRLIYIEGKSQDEAAEILGYSKGYFSRLHSDAISRLSSKYRGSARRLNRQAPGLEDRIRTGIPLSTGLRCVPRALHPPRSPRFVGDDQLAPVHSPGIRPLRTVPIGDGLAVVAAAPWAGPVGARGRICCGGWRGTVGWMRRSGAPTSEWRRCWRTRRGPAALGAVGCMNIELRIQQARHRRMTQPMLDLKRLYRNTHVFRSGPRQGLCPYRALGLDL